MHHISYLMSWFVYLTIYFLFINWNVHPVVCFLCIRFKYTENPGWRITQGCQCTFTAVRFEWREDLSVGVTRIPDPRCFQRFIQCHRVPRPWGREEDLLVSSPQSLRCDHYDVGVFESKLFLPEMPEGIYSNKEKHICNEACYLCHKWHEDQTEYWQYCSTCNRHFKNTTCFQLHAEVTSQGNSTCQTFYRCKQCSTTVNRKKSRQPHVCDNKYWDTCKMFMSDDHVCYMKTTAEEEATKLSKRKRKKKNNEDDAVKKWIFFDFECTQDERIQCN